MERLFAKIAAKAIIRQQYRPEMLLANQFGPFMPNGTSPAVNILREVIEGGNASKVKSVVRLNLINAYNAADRRRIAAAVATYAPSLYQAAKWMYALMTASHNRFTFAQGVRRGDPLAPLLLSLALRPSLEALQAALPTATFVAYVDEIYVLSRDDTDVIAAAMRVFADAAVQLDGVKSAQYPIMTLRSLRHPYWFSSIDVFQSSTFVCGE